MGEEGKEVDLEAIVLLLIIRSSLVSKETPAP